MTNYKHILTYGFAIFAMFFGSGNLVFPIIIGHQSGGSWFFGFLGLFATGVILPFLGLFVIKLHRGNYDNFFSEAGYLAKIIIPFFTLSLLGSFGVVPRCITVAHGGINYLFPEFSLMQFAIIFSLFSFIFSIREQFMLKILGKWMSPLLLIILSILIGYGVIIAPEDLRQVSIEAAFSGGILTGYQTMDLFAAFFFSALIFNQIQNAKLVPESELLKFAIKSSVIGSSLLGLIYMGLVYLGAHYSFLLINIPPEHMLQAIAGHIMGSIATLFLALAIIISCLTTAIALNSIYARYLCKTFKLSEKRFPVISFCTSLIAFAISLLDFKAIAAFLAPSLEASYPALIFLTLASIFTKKYRKTKLYLFWGITIFMIIYMISVRGGF